MVLHWLKKLFVPTRLGDRLVLVSALVMTLAVTVFTAYIAWKSIEYERRTSKDVTQVIAKDIAAYSAGHLLVNDLAELELALKRTMKSGHINRLSIVKPDGRLIVSMTRDNNNRVRSAFGSKDRLKPPATEKALLHTRKGQIESWNPIKSNGMIGWVFIRTDYATLPGLTRDVLLSSSLIIVLSMLLSILVFRQLLKKPVSMINNATGFAETLPQTHGRQLEKYTSCEEFIRLIDALNQASTLLKQQKIERDHARGLLDIIRGLQGDFIDSGNTEPFHNMLSALLELMSSNHGMLAEVANDDHGRVYLRVLATASRAEKVQNFVDQHRDTVVELHDLDNLVGETIYTGKPVIANQAMGDVRSGQEHMPPGHPLFERFLGLPLYSGDELVGMIGIGNRDEAYCDADVSFLQSLTSSCGNILNAYRRNEQRKQAESKLQKSEASKRHTLDTIHDAIITVNSDGLIMDTNRATGQMFDCAAGELENTDISALFDADTRTWISACLENARESAGRLHREVVALRHPDHEFPAELDITPMLSDSNQSFLFVIRDISERHRIDRMKDEFISTVSHELRTPLTSIRGSLGLVSGGVGGPLNERGQDLMHIASNNIDRLMALINNILDLERLQSEDQKSDHERINLSQMVRNAVLDNTGYARQFDVEFDIVRCVPDLHINGNPENLLQLLANLLSNAAKFSSPGSRVSVTVDQSSHNARVEVCNQGPGIPPDIGKQIFGRFVQGDSSDTRRHGGTGLGLSICKTIVDQHQGIIDFESSKEKGTCFFFELALADSTAKPLATSGND